MTGFWDHKVTKKAMKLPDEVEVQSPDGSPLDGAGAEPCIVKLDELIKRHLAQKMITGKQSFETTFKRYLASAIKQASLTSEADDGTVVETAEGDTGEN